MTSEGPMVTRLRQALVGADETQIDTAASEWNDGAFLLGTVKDALEKAKPTMAANFGKNTRDEAVSAFDTMIAKVEKRRKQMEDAGTALVAAKAALTPAKELRDRFDANPLTDPGPFRPDPAMTRQQQNDAEAAHSVTRGNFLDAFNAREREAERAYRNLDTTYEGSGEVLRGIHGEPDRTGGGSGGSGAPGGAGTPGGGGTPARGPQWSPTPGDPTWVPHPGNDHGDPGAHTTTTTTTTTTLAVSGDPGVAQGPGITPTTPGSTPLAPASVPTGSTPGAVGGVAAALGGGLLGGMAGVSGAVRGGGVSAVPSSASGARPIGSTSRTGASGALGRSASATGAPTSRAGANGAAGRGAAGRGASGTGSPGSRGKAGARGSVSRSGAARGAAAAGGAGRTQDKDKKKGQEFFEDVQDWIDDEGAAPGVID